MNIKSLLAGFLSVLLLSTSALSVQAVDKNTTSEENGVLNTVSSNDSGQAVESSNIFNVSTESESNDNETDNETDSDYLELTDEEKVELSNLNFNSFEEGFTDIVVTDAETAIDAISSVADTIGLCNASEELRLDNVKTLDGEYDFSKSIMIYPYTAEM